MKHFLLTIIFCCTGLLTFSQTTDWAPVGAKWRYDHYVFGAFTGPMIQTITKDTLINGILAKELVQAFFNNQSFNKPISSDTFYIAHDSNRYHLYRNGTFYPFYDRRWNTGDTVTLPGVNYSCPDSTGKQEVLGAGTHTAMGKPWRFTEFDHPPTEADWGIGSGYYYPLFGGRAGLLPFPTCLLDGGGYRMVCYKDDHHPGIFLDQYDKILDTVGVCDLYAEPVGRANPLNRDSTYHLAWYHNNLHINGPAGRPVMLSLMDMTGSVLWQTTTTIPAVLEVPAIPTGIYLVTLSNEEGPLLATKKITNLKR